MLTLQLVYADSRKVKLSIAICPSPPRSLQPLLGLVFPLPSVVLAESKSGTDGLGAGELGEGSKSVNKEGNKGLQKADAALPMTKETISYALTAACALVLAGELVSKVAFGGRISAM